MRLSSTFYHIVNKDRCSGELNKQCKCEFKFILTVDLMQTLPYCYKTRVFLQPGVLHKEKKIIMHVWQKRELQQWLADKKECEQAIERQFNHTLGLIRSRAGAKEILLESQNQFLFENEQWSLFLTRLSNRQQ